MKTITLRADEALINQILAISKALANETSKKLETITLEQIKAEAMQQARTQAYEEDIELYKQGKLKTCTLDELEEEMKTW